jgi:tetratricopeptide (TPR) repeat protein
MAAQYADCDKYNAHVLSVDLYFKKCPFSISAPWELAETLAHCGWYYYERGQSICLKLGAPGGSSTIALVYALVCNNLGVVINTKQMYQRAQASQYALNTTYSNYANNLSGLGQVDCAQEYFLKGIEIRENCPGATAAPYFRSNSWPTAVIGYNISHICSPIT